MSGPGSDFGTHEDDGHWLLMVPEADARELQAAAERQEMTWAQLARSFIQTGLRQLSEAEAHIAEGRRRG